QGRRESDAPAPGRFVRDASPHQGSSEGHPGAPRPAPRRGTAVAGGGRASVGSGREVRRLKRAAPAFIGLAAALVAALLAAVAFGAEPLGLRHTWDLIVFPEAREADSTGALI